ncbi:hypothetical protein TH63_11745 [Rufibacter radiotolerans]|uniref:Copper chaperone NosL n=1 Tax=Rufibacter radiotolerans TaxID=1379910 RepID=A0A0H4W6U9_9BACT|nr:nitrous oxide reductase accessory protein NosL [Rufibacter radiotolerans]AKQ46151.1 hypothetical protein TH63_11745 [Rufibacter radiotolerans]
MKDLSLLFILMLLIGIMGSCQVEPKPIPFGAANCAHCNMTVADNRFGAEIVNEKGKAFFFDSGECLIAYLKEQPELQDKAAFVLVSDFTNPSKLIDARQATYVQSKAIPSPMGMHLLAVENKSSAVALQQENGGRLLTWNEAVLAVQNNERPE